MTRIEMLEKRQFEMDKSKNGNKKVEMEKKSGVDDKMGFRGQPKSA